MAKTDNVHLCHMIVDLYVASTKAVAEAAVLSLPNLGPVPKGFGLGQQTTVSITHRDRMQNTIMCIGTCAEGDASP